MGKPQITQEPVKLESVSKPSQLASLERHAAQYVAAMDQLVDVVQELSRARDLDAIVAIVRKAARELTKADGATFVLRDQDQCYYAEENAISPLWKGKRFPMSTCISGWVMNHAEPVMIEDIYRDERIPQDAYRPTFVKSLAMVPIRRNAPIGAIGNYWAVHRRASEEELAILQALADTTSVAMENARLYTDLQANISILQEREARIHEQHAALEIFTRALAHDLKEPMRTIHAYTQLIEQKENFSGKSAEHFHHVKHASGRMLMLIDTVFQYMQLDHPHRTATQYTNAGAAAMEAQDNLMQLIQERGATISIGQLPHLQANPVQLAQVFQNLITNAIRHSPKPVTLQISAAEKDGAWQFTVADNGPGIDAKHLETIFQPFKRITQNEEGAGLGLAICHKIVDAHGGKIWCESQPGKGAKFTFTIPGGGSAQTPDVHVKAVESSYKVPYPELASILLVDDRKSDLELTQMMLVDCLGLECNLLLAQSGKEALELLHQAREKKAPIDLVLLDINMPEMDGFEMLEILRADDALKSTAVIMCTGSTYSKDRERAELLGAAGYLVKPVPIELMKRAIAKMPSLNLQEKEAGYSVHRAANGAA